MTDSRFIHVAINDSVPFHTVHSGRKSLCAGFPGGAVVRKPPANVLDAGSIPGLGKIPWRRKWQPIPVFLPGKIPWTEESGGLQSMGLQRVGHDWARRCAAHTPKQGVGGCCTSLRAERLRRLFGILLHRICLFSLMYLLIYISMGSYDVHGCLFYSLACNSTQCELFVQMIPVLVTGNGFRLTPVSLWDIAILILFLALPYLLAVQDALGLSCLLPIPGLESAASQSGPVPFIGGCHWGREI